MTEPNMPEDPTAPADVYASDDENVLGLVVIVDRGDRADMVIRAKRIHPNTFADMLQHAVDQIRAGVRAHEAKRN